jgi:hypothetical protein
LQSFNRRPRQIEICLFHTHIIPTKKGEVKMQTQQPERFASALYLPGLKSGVSREF